MAELNNPYSDSLTSGGLAAEELINDLADSPDEDDGKPIGPAPDDAPFITNGEYETERRKYFENADTLVKATDPHIVTVLGEINTLKQQIADLTVEAFDHVDQGGVLNTTDNWSDEDKRLAYPPPNGSDVILTTLGNGDPWLPSIYVGITLFDYGHYIINFGTPDEETLNYVGAKATVQHDYVAVYKYPVLEDEDFTSQSYIDGSEGWVFLVNGEEGVGNPAKYSYDQQDNTTQEIEETLTPPTVTGNVYVWKNKAQMNNALNGSGDDVAAKLVQIKEKRDALLPYIEAALTGSNKFRDARFKYQRELWIELRSQNAVNTGSVDAGEVYTALTDPEKQEDISLYNG